eukprot:scaffold42978_cov55-Phaeocystis_antarctica.AAC.2
MSERMMRGIKNDGIKDSGSLRKETSTRCERAMFAEASWVTLGAWRRPSSWVAHKIAAYAAARSGDLQTTV